MAGHRALRWGLAALLGGLVATLLPEPAQAQLSDRFSQFRIYERHGLVRPWSAQRDAELEARDGGGAWSVYGSLGAGFDSNLFDGRKDRRESALASGWLRVEHLRLPTDHDRLRLRAQIRFRSHAASSRTDEYVQEISALWRHNWSPGLQLQVEGGLKHENDDIANSEGFDSRRDFEHTDYWTQAGFRWRLGEGHRIRAMYRARYRDHVPTSGLPSLDFWLHGPSVGYRIDLPSRVRLDFSYVLRLEDYSSSPARDRTGTLEIGNPKERHALHRVRAEARWRPTPSITWSFAQEYQRKDDRHESFESFHEFVSWVSLDWRTRSPLRLRLEAAFTLRDFDERRSRARGNLGTERYFGGVSLHYELTSRLWWFGFYHLDLRDSNRTFGNEFRDYTTHRAISGLAFAY